MTEEPTKRSIDRKALAGALRSGLGVDHEELSRLTQRADWTVERCASEIEVDGWQARLREQARAAREREIEFHCASTSGPAPGALGGMRPAELCALVSVPKLKDFAERYDPFEHGGRLVLGSTGIGKTAACAAVGRRLREANVRLKFSPKLEGERDYDHLTRTRGRYLVWARAFDLANARLEHALGRGEADDIRNAVKCDFLVLDDIGWESKRAGGDDVVLEVIAERYDSGRPTCATSGLRIGQFIERYGEAVMRRIVETGGPRGKVLDLWPREDPK